MTREEAVKFAEHAVNITGISEVKEFYRMAAVALTPPTQEQVEKVWRGEWINTNNEVEQMCKCSKCGYPISYFWSRTQFCANCGAPMTDEAVGMVMERWEELHG